MRVESCTIHMRTISLVALRTAHHSSRSSSVYAMDSLVVQLIALCEWMQRSVSQF
jgi:hypothetical protein